MTAACAASSPFSRPRRSATTMPFVTSRGHDAGATASSERSRSRTATARSSLSTARRPPPWNRAAARGCNVAMSTPPSRDPHVVIVGAGFAGLWTARALRSAPVRVTLIDRNNFHTFLPLLYQVASADLGPADIAYPVRSIFRGATNIDFRMAEATDLDLEARQVVTDRALSSTTTSCLRSAASRTSSGSRAPRSTPFR
jgi:hypothetical protein